MEHITRINENDVLLGRGGRNHEHSGNNQLRRIAHSRVRDYSAASKKQKAVISRYVTFQLLLSAFSCTYDYNADPTFYSYTNVHREILHQIQTMDPPGRFLLKNYSTYEWDVVSDSVAREKVCQVSVL